MSLDEIAGAEPACSASYAVGWLGAVAVFLALAIAGVLSLDGQLVREAYLAMDLTYWFVIGPLCFASALTGRVSSLATGWGLFRRYWVLIKPLLTIPATLLLVAQTGPVSFLADVAAKTNLPGGDLGRLRLEPPVYAAAALLVLLVLMGLSVFKPRGMTRYGQRKQRALLVA